MTNRLPPSDTPVKTSLMSCYLIKFLAFLGDVLLKDDQEYQHDNSGDNNDSDSDSTIAFVT